MTRTVRTAGLLAAAALCGVVLAQPASATEYHCTNGNLYIDGQNAGAHGPGNPYDLGGGITTYCRGSRIVTIYQVPN
jgi:hypothetical protein